MSTASPSKSPPPSAAAKTPPLSQDGSRRPGFSSTKLEPYLPFTVRLPLALWEQLDTLRKERTYRTLFDDAVALLPEQPKMAWVPVLKSNYDPTAPRPAEPPADRPKDMFGEQGGVPEELHNKQLIREYAAVLNEFVKRNTPVSRRKGKGLVPRGVAIGLSAWKKLIVLNGVNQPSKHPKNKALDLKKLTVEERRFAMTFNQVRIHSMAEILRAALTAYVWKVRSLQPDHPLNAAPDLVQQPKLICGFDCRVFKGDQPLGDLPSGTPVLIDHSVLLLAVLRKEPAEEDRKSDTFSTQDQLSLECAALIAKSERRKVLIHAFHQARFLSELKRLLETGSKEFAASPSALADHLAETTRLLAGMELKVLGLDAEDRRLQGSSEHFQERLAIAAARRYLGEDPFVFVSAFLPVESLDGMPVSRPSYLQPSLGAVSLTATRKTEEAKPAEGAAVEAAAAEAPKAEPAPPEPPQVEAAQTEVPVEVLPVEVPRPDPAPIEAKPVEPAPAEPKAGDPPPVPPSGVTPKGKKVESRYSVDDGMIC